MTHARGIAVLMLVAGCQQGAGSRRDLTAAVGTASRATIGDLDGDGRAELAVADDERLRVLDAHGAERASVPGAGGIDVLTVIDGWLWAGWGMSREHHDAPAHVMRYQLGAQGLTAESVLAPQTTRAEIAAIVPRGDGTVLIAYYDDKFMVRALVWDRGQTTDLAHLRMATAYAIGDVDGDGAPDLVVGRIYGDAKDVDGDAFVLRPDGSRVMIPTTRGVRSVALADTDGDGKLEIFLSDGWHQDYGTTAKGLLTRATWDGTAFRSELVENTPGQFTDGELLVAHDRDGHAVIVSNGSKDVRVFRRSGGAWTSTAVAPNARDLAVGDLDGRPGDELLVVGDRSQILSL